MKRFLLIIVCFFGIPLLALLGVYLWTDPFKTLRPFNINDVDNTNREYQSVELLKRNYPKYHYDSYVFCSSQGSGWNTYTWKMYLPDDASPFLFQAWSETITGVYQKVAWLAAKNMPVRHAIVLIDIPGFFSTNQNPHEALSVKHYELSGESPIIYHAREYYNFIQNPKAWTRAVVKQVHQEQIPFDSDTITNDFFRNNRLNYFVCPPQDSLKSCTNQTRATFMAKISNASETDVVMSSPLLTPDIEPVLQQIRDIFVQQQTDYYIVIAPSYRYVHPYLNAQDLQQLNAIFGNDRVFDFTTDIELTSDYNDFFDPIHFGTILGWKMLKKMYQ